MSERLSNGTIASLTTANISNIRRIKLFDMMCIHITKHQDIRKLMQRAISIRSDILSYMFLEKKGATNEKEGANRVQ